MSFNATRQVWEMRRAGRLPGGVHLFVLLALADHADRASGEVSRSVRYIAEEIDLARSSVHRGIQIGLESGALALLKPGGAHRSAVYRFPVTLSLQRDDAPVDNPATSSLRGDDDGATSSQLRPNFVPPEGQIPVLPVAPEPPTRAGARTRVREAVVAVELHIATARGEVRRPNGWRSSTANRIEATYGDRIARELSSGADPRVVAAGVLADDGVNGSCPVESCGATDAQPIADVRRCVRGERCPYFVPAVG